MGPRGRQPGKLLFNMKPRTPKDVRGRCMAATAFKTLGGMPLRFKEKDFGGRNLQDFKKSPPATAFFTQRRVLRAHPPGALLSKAGKGCESPKPIYFFPNFLTKRTPFGVIWILITTGYPLSKSSERWSIFPPKLKNRTNGNCSLELILLHIFKLRTSIKSRLAIFF